MLSRFRWSYRFDWKLKIMVKCHQCQYYYVTWDSSAPHGCRALKFKSLQLPSLVVHNTTPDLECQAFIKKEVIGQQKNGIGSEKN